MVSDKYERPMHPLVEIFVDSKLEEYPADEEEDVTLSTPPLIGLLWTMKEGEGFAFCHHALLARVCLRMRVSMHDVCALLGIYVCVCV